MITDDTGPVRWWKRIAWFIALWLAGVLAVGSVAYLIRAWIA